MAGIIDVVAAVIPRGHRVLAARRSDRMALPNQWEFPGGKIEADESPEDALIRELREEMNCTIEVGARIQTTRHAYPFATIRLATFYASLLAGEPQPTEHAELRWCSLDELSTLQWAPADLPAVASVLADLRARQR